MHNANPAMINELGHTAHTSHKAGLAGRGTLGALRVQWQGMEFGIGTGFDDINRQLIWNHRPAFLGKLVKFKYLAIGMKDKPRHPVFLGWRDPIDL
jgi:DNA ligase-1